MFSGGRDSTLAAIRLAQEFSELMLVTVSSEHLIGVEKVAERIQELAPHLPAGSQWVRLKQMHSTSTESLIAATCLPCHRSYVAAGVALARQESISNLAFGYAGYQSAWPEQTAHATDLLKKLLGSAGIQLHLPVYELVTKQQAISQLEALKLKPEALEQKCLKQQTNIELAPQVLLKELDRWEKSTRAELAKPTSQVLNIVSRQFINGVSSNVPTR